MRWVAVVLVLVLAYAVIGSAMDPYMNFPLVSQAVCSLKGDIWYGGGLLGLPGCYAP